MDKSIVFFILALISFAICKVNAQVQVDCAPSYDGMESWSSLHGSQAGDVTISSGQSVLFDVEKATVGKITIEEGGKLTFDWQKNIELTADHILVNGELHIGSSSCPFSNNVTISLQGEEDAELDGFDMGKKCFGVGKNGVLELHGSKGLGSSWTKLAATAEKGESSITIEDDFASSDSSARDKWQVGDVIVVASTDYSHLQSEKLTIVGIDGNTLEISPSLQYTHFGEITHEVDEKAEVILLSRNIVIQGLNDGELGKGEGGHVIFLRGFKSVQVEGVELRRMGQDHLARYPLHMHLVGKVPENTILKDNAIHDSHFRCITLHGASGVNVEGNVAYNNYGHCYYLEDGVEENNKFTRNVGLLSHPKTWGDHHGTDASEGYSTFWITNPNNEYKGNVAVGSNTGYWVFVRSGPSGLSSRNPENSNVNPSLKVLALFEDNVVHSSHNGFQIDVLGVDGNDNPPHEGAAPATYLPRDSKGNDVTTYVTGLVAYKIRDRGIWARSPNLIVRKSFFADCFEGVQLATSGSQPPYVSMQYIEDSVFVGWSDNRGNEATDEYQIWDDEYGSYSSRDAGQPMSGVKLYDGGTIVKGCKFINFKGSRNAGPHGGIGARYVNSNQMATTNAFEDCTFENNDRRVALLDKSGDGGKTFNFRDESGSVGDQPGSTIVPDYGYYKTSECTSSDQLYGVISCPHKYVQLFVYDMDKKDYTNNIVVTRNNHDGNDHSEYSLTLTGLPGIAAQKVWQPITIVGGSYLLHWENTVSKNIAIQLANAEKGEEVELAICYPSGSSIESVHRGYVDILARAAPLLPDKSHSKSQEISAAGSVEELDGSNYYWDSDRNIMFIKIKQSDERTNVGNFCPDTGCDWIWISSNGEGAGRDCTEEAYSGNSVQKSESISTRSVKDHYRNRNTRLNRTNKF